LNDQDFHAWADAIDSRPSYGSHTGGYINYMGPGVMEKRSRQVPAWKRSAARRQYQLRLMQARLEMEELL
jgi:hypothetical protein